MENEDVVDTRNAKTEEYKRVLEKILRDGKCPFCFENFEKYARSKYVPMRETPGWFLVKNSWPYPNAEHHLLVIPKRHYKDFCKLTVSDMTQVQKLIGYAQKTFSITGGGITLRFGDPVYTGATVAHLHFHLIVPKLDPVTNKAAAVSFPIG